MITTTEDSATLKAKWLSGIASAYGRYCRAGWEFIFLLRDGIDTLPRNDQERAKLYEDTYHLTGLSIHTMQNYVSAARKPYAQTACELGLEIGHLDAVLGLDDEIAEDVLKLAAEESWPVARTRKEAWARKDVPDVGKELADAVDRMLSDDEPPYNDNAMYDDEPRRYALPDDITELVQAIKARYSAGDIATLVAELAAIPY